MKKTLIHCFEYGLWIIPVVFGGIVYAWRGIPPDPPMTEEQYITAFVGALLTFMWYFGEKTSNLKYLNEHDGREAAMRPKPSSEMLYVKPTGFCFGKYGKKYYCKQISEPGSILVTGASGSGKSKNVIEEFLLNPENKENCNYLVLDLKGELSHDTVFPDEIYHPSSNPDGNCILLDPLDRRNGFGYNPFFLLTADSTESEVHETVEKVVNALVPLSKGDDQVWNNAARRFLRGAMTFFCYEKKMRSVPEIIKAIKSDTIENIVNLIIDSTTLGSSAYVEMIGFKDMASETITSVDMNMSNSVTTLLTNQDLCWCLADCPRKCSPKDLLDKSIYLLFPKDKMEQWANMIFLIFTQTLNWMDSLPEKNYAPERKFFAVILDEMAALEDAVKAPIPVSNFLRLSSRGVGCTTLIATQSTAILSAIGGEKETSDMLSNLVYKVIYESSEDYTNKSIIKWCGTYKSRKASSSGSGRDRKISFSYQDENIVRDEDLYKLPGTGEVIIISNRDGYKRLKKSPVFKDPYFKKFFNRIKDEKEALAND